ncbi:hypothetical protein HNO88_002063 [Novosphingobium chloroacetimidivorans]|uniref:EthD domain-containing protein n=1 Tax=Novosphingobium chloroacetimidivorans TaxID=1428314 RepID=A0A7W7K9J6_9SPHN|nr:EthD domain-containing protein [Novosphingobium chloroacetimidivorans]MBB4858737.1 hypothetical protein [Novosphingobium chloroacetimidivorans]
MFKQIFFFRKREDMTLDEFLDYYEKQHSQVARKANLKPAIANAERYVRRYLQPERNWVTGEVHDPGFDCIMEIWWNSREDFEASQRVIADPERLPFTKADEARLFASHANPVCSILYEGDSPMGPGGEPTRVQVIHGT